jgi:hypothetical protein
VSCRLHRDRIAVFDEAVAGLDEQIAGRAGRWQRELDLLKIACQVLKTGTPYQDLGADVCTRRESPARQHVYLERRLQKLYPGRAITITTGPPEAALASAVSHAP